ncbi:MAG: DUF2804 domain-containing protein [Bacilli bacterium]|nr:DUF2804 domain-containing protein [Bacilli bacterium]
MGKELKRTYVSFRDEEKRNQVEYSKETDLLDEKGKLLVEGGYGRHDYFRFDAKKAKPRSRLKQWDFYQISNGKFMAQVSFANISLAGYISVVLVDLSSGKKLVDNMNLFVGGKKYPLPPVSDKPNILEYSIGKAHFKFETNARKRTLDVKMLKKKVTINVHFEMDMLEEHENLTTVIPFKNKPTRFFMTTKQNCMPTEGIVTYGNEKWEFSKEDTFGVLDWGRVNTPYKLVWYWGNASTYLVDKDGNKHPFGFEITWGIGNEKNATETALFYDGKLHKFGSIDVKRFVKDRYMETWEFESEDGRFAMTLTPTLDHHSDLNLLVLRMNSHQVHGLYNGKVTLDDGTVLEIKDMYGFCEYVENRW